MADFLSNLQRIFSRLNTFRIIYISAITLVAATFVVYSLILEQKGKERMRETYDLRNEHDNIRALQADLENYVYSSYLNAIRYLAQGKDIYLYETIGNISEVNKTYNQLFTIYRKMDGELVSKTVQLKSSIFQFERQVLTKLMERKPFENIDIQPIISDQDTLEQDFSELQNVAAANGVLSAEIQTLDMKEIEASESAITDQLFELSILLQAKIDAVAQEKINNGVLDIGILIFFILLAIVLLICSFLLITRLLNQKINKVITQLQTLSKGELPEKLRSQNDVFDNVIENGNAIINYLDDSSKFALKIGDGDFNYEFHLKSEKDELGNALIQMRKKLQEVAVADRVRNWLNEGQAKFGDILRNTGDDFEKLGNNIISNLVEYLHANQGVLYVKEGSEEDHIQLNLLSAYAFKRKKHIERKIEVGEGLIGQAFQEKKTIFLKEVKTDHFNIVTGLGESKPSSVLIVPLKNEEEIEGVIEIASFEVFKDHQISFVEKIGESIASSIKTGKINDTTKRLFAEMQTREEEMKAQEEELKQNMEELSATQEQLERLRKEDESRKNELEAKRGTLYDVLNNTGSMIYLKDDAGKFVYVNKQFADFLNNSIENIIGKEGKMVLEAETAHARESLEKRVLEEDITITEKEATEDGDRNITISPFFIKHLEIKGVLGLIN